MAACSCNSSSWLARSPPSRSPQNCSLLAWPTASARGCAASDGALIRFVVGCLWRLGWRCRCGIELAFAGSIATSMPPQTANSLSVFQSIARRFGAPQRKCKHAPSTNLAFPRECRLSNVATNQSLLSIDMSNMDVLQSIIDNT